MSTPPPGPAQQNHNRVASGRPTGGQFATHRRDEVEAVLEPPSRGAVDDAREREAAEEAVRVIEFGWRNGYDNMGLGALRRAARDLEPHLPEHQSAALREAGDTLDQATTGTADPRPAGAVNVLHAELVDALSDAPSRRSIERLHEQVTAASGQVDDAEWDLNLGQGGEAALAYAREVELTAISSLNRAKPERRDATLMRVAQGRPTAYDMWETQTRADIARMNRRAATNDADVARWVWATTAPDDPELDRRRLAVDEQTRREAEAQDAHDQAKADLDAANDAWRRMRN